MSATHSLSDNGHDHGHSHLAGLKGFFYNLFVPHSHDADDSIDDALEASREGVQALKISLFLLLGTTLLQFAVVLLSGSVALLADTVHDFSDALTAVPLWIAFILGRRVATRRYTYGYGRAEDLAGLFIIIAVVALSAVVVAWQSIDRFINPHPLQNPWWAVAAGFIGFAGNEAVAIYRIRVGQKIGSAAFVADGVHARIDGFTSLAVVLGAFGAFGAMAGFRIADPIVGLLISLVIVALLWGTVRSISRRLMDGIEPELVHKIEHALTDTPGVRGVDRVQLRWVGHRLQGGATMALGDVSLGVADKIAVPHVSTCASPSGTSMTSPSAPSAKRPPFKWRPKVAWGIGEGSKSRSRRQTCGACTLHRHAPCFGSASQVV